MDIHLNYTEKGEGDPLVLLHGNGGDSGYFVHQTEHFSRGHGKSPRGDAPFTIAQFAEYLKDFLDGKKLKRPIF